MAEFTFPSPDRIREDVFQNSLKMAAQALFLLKRPGFFVIQVFETNHIISAQGRFPPFDATEFIANYVENFMFVFLFEFHFSKIGLFSVVNPLRRV